MYETIMELPLFKGIGEEQLSLMLEKTSMEFLKFDDGDIIAEYGTKVKSLDFILSGQVSNTFRLENFKLSIEEILTKGNVLGALNLYGLDTTYNSNYIAQGKVSILKIEKSQYMNILQSDSIYILNFVNFLSAAAQKGSTVMIDSDGPSITNRLNLLTRTVASRGAETIILRGPQDEMARYCGVSRKEFEIWVEEEVDRQHIRKCDNGLIIKSHTLNT